MFCCVELELVMNWGNLEKKYNKIGWNGYSRKELVEYLRYLFVDLNFESINVSGGGGGISEF